VCGKRKREIKRDDKNPQKRNKVNTEEPTEPSSTDAPHTQSDPIAEPSTQPDPIAEAKKLMLLMQNETTPDAVLLVESLRSFLVQARIQFMRSKPVVERKNVTADEAFHITSLLDNGPVINWTTEQINDTIAFVCGVNTYFMRGSGKAMSYLRRFLKEWGDFVLAHPKVRDAVDPEFIVFDNDWAPPANWALSTGQANNNLAENALINAGIPAPGVILPGAPDVPSGGSDTLFASLDGNAATHFGGFVTGANHTHVRGYWHISSPNPATYY
jgi:hypothetical protein